MTAAEPGAGTAAEPVKVVVTGGSGFLGRHIVARLGARSLSRRVGVDVLDRASLRAAFVGAEVVVHAAGNVSHDPADAAATWDVHVRGTENVIEAARAAGVRRVIHLSSSGTVAVSRGDSVATEGSATPMELIATLPYYRAKLFAEQLALAASSAGRGGIEVVSLNPSLLLGPGDTERRSVRVVQSHLQGWLRAIPSGGLSFVDARDVADAVALAVTKGVPGRRYLLGAVNWTFADFYARLARITELPLPRVTLPKLTGRVLGWLGPVDLSDHSGGVDRWEIDLACLTWYLDARRARTELGWTPRDPSRTLADTVADLERGP